MDSEDYVPLEQSKGSDSSSFAHKKRFRQKTENVKRGRIIVRNLSFKINDDLLKKEFSKFGELTEVNLLKKHDGKLVGCAFLQYNDYNSAINAIKSMNGKDLLKRKISVEFAVSKNRYQNTHKDDVKMDIEVKEEEPEVKEEEIKEESSDDEDPVDENSDEDESESDNEEIDKPKAEIKNEKKYTEADNEFTVFIKNLNFETTNEDLEGCFKKFGPIKYALVVRDRVSGHSKGTGFVRFLKKESVQVCLAQNGKITLQDFALEILPTLSKQTVKNIEKVKIEEKKTPKDGRNLYLLREGMILAGSEAAEGVSASDMAKRLRLEQIKSQMLKNLTRFIAKDRLTIHNLPESYDDEKLRKMVMSKTHTKPIECRVMRENKPSPGFPLGKSKGFGFLSFKRHEDALKVLRKLNNNPEIFSAGNRPIVSFSIEDMNVHKIKEKRKLRSMLNNPTYQKKMEKVKLKKQQKKKDKNDKKPLVAPLKKKKTPKYQDEGESFSGFASKPGAVAKLRGTFKLKQQSRIHEKSMKERNKKTRMEKFQAEVKREKQEKKLDRQVSRKRKFDNGKDSLTDKIEKYRSLMKGMGEVASKKRKVAAGGNKWSID